MVKEEKKMKIKKEMIYLLIILLMPIVAFAQGDVISDVTSMFTGALDFSGVMGTLSLLMTILIFAGSAFIIVYIVYKMRKYKIMVIVLAKAGDEYVFLRFDRVGIFKDKSGLSYSKFRRTRERIENLDYRGILRDQHKKQLAIMIKEGDGAYYQVIIPKKFYSVDGKVALPVIDQNVMRSAITTLTNQQRKYRLQDTIMAKYGVHIALLVVIVVLVVGGYILLKKEEQIISLASDLIETTKGLQEALVNKAVGT